MVRRIVIKRIFVFILVVAAFTSVGIGLRLRESRVAASAKSRQVSLPTVPFIVIRSSVTVVPGNPVPVHSEMRSLAVRSDGSSAELFHRKDPSGSGNVIFIRGIVDVPNKQRVLVDPISESLITYPLADEAVSTFAIRGATQCAGTSSSPILGYDVAVEEVRDSSSPEELRITSWRAASLNCIPLRREIMVLKSGTEVQRITETVLRITEGEPDKSLFDIPQGYVERQPSDAMAEAAKRYPNDPDWRCPNCAQSQARKDEAYWKHRVQH
jgi:hypothetical protein